MLDDVQMVPAPDAEALKRDFEALPTAGSAVPGWRCKRCRWEFWAVTPPAHRCVGTPEKQ